MPKLPRIYYVEDDRLPDLAVEFEGTDLSGYTSILLHLRRADGKLVVKTAVIDDVTNGFFHFAWAAGDLAEGKHQAEIRLTTPTGQTLTFPEDQALEVHVRPRV
jgi:hypothetical protein